MSNSLPKIAYLLPSLHTSGWQRYIRSLLPELALQIEPILVVAREDKELADKLFPNWPIFELPVIQNTSLTGLRSRWQLLYSMWRARQLKLPEVSMIHSLEAYPTGLLGQILAKRLGLPHILTVHGTYGVHWRIFPLDRWAYQKILPQVDVVCPISEGTLGLMSKFFPTQMNQVTVQVILNGNNYFKKIPQQRALDRTWPDTPTLLTVGDIKPRKGIHISLQAFAQVHEQLPSARYWIVGGYDSENEYYRELTKFVRENGLEEAVIFTGRLDDDELDHCYNEASAFVLTSQEENLRFEGFGLVFLEAGAYGLPVIGTKTGGIPDAVLHGKTGLLTAPDNITAIADAMLRLLSDQDYARQLGRANRAWSEQLTWERSASQYLELYRSLLN